MARARIGARASIGRPLGLRTRRLSASGVFAQLSLLAAIPLMTRFVAAESVALYQIALSIGVILQVAMTGGLEYLIPSASKSIVLHLRRRARRYRLLALFIAAASAGSLLVAGSSTSAQVLLGASAMGAVYATFATDSAVFARQNQIRVLERRNYTFGFLLITSQVAACLLIPSFWSLVAGVVLARLSAVVIVRGRAGTENSLVPGEADSTTDDVLSSRQSTAWFAAILVSNLAVQLPVLLVSLQSFQQAGELSLAIRLAGLPASVVGAAVSQSFALHLAGMVREGMNRAVVPRFVQRNQVRWALVGLTLGGLQMLLTPFITLLLGDEWRRVSTFVLVLALPFSLQLVNRIVTPFYILFNCAGTLLLLQSVRVLLTGACLWTALALVDNILIATIVFASSNALYSAVFGLATYRLSNRLATTSETSSARQAIIR